MTKYEIAATKDGNRFTVAYTGRMSKSNLVNNVRHYGPQISLAIGADENSVCISADKNAVVMSDGTRVFYSGRTELDVARAA